MLCNFCQYNIGKNNIWNDHINCSYFLKKDINENIEYNKIIADHISFGWEKYKSHFLRNKELVVKDVIKCEFFKNKR